MAAVEFPELDCPLHDAASWLTVVKDAIEQEGCDDGHLVGFKIMLQFP